MVNSAKPQPQAIVVSAPTCAFCNQAKAYFHILRWCAAYIRAREGDFYD